MTKVFCVSYIKAIFESFFVSFVFNPFISSRSISWLLLDEPDSVCLCPKDSIIEGRIICTSYLHF